MTIKLFICSTARAVSFFEVVFGPLIALPIVPLMGFHRSSMIGLPMPLKFLANTHTQTHTKNRALYN